MLTSISNGVFRDLVYQGPVPLRTFFFRVEQTSPLVLGQSFWIRNTCDFPLDVWDKTLLLMFLGFTL